MKIKLRMLVAAVLMTCAGVQAGVFGENTPPDKFMNLEVGALRHYGSTSGYGFTLRQYVEAMKPIGGKQEWKKDGDKRWTHIITIDDAATGTKQRMALVFEESDKYASVVRFVDNDKEVTPQYVGTAADQLMLPIAQKLNIGNKSNVASEGKNKTKGKVAKPVDFSGVYVSSYVTVELKAAAVGKYNLTFKGRCLDDTRNINPIEGQVSDLVFKKDPEEDGLVTRFKAGKCEIRAVVVAQSGMKFLTFHEENGCCSGTLERGMKKQ